MAKKNLDTMKSSMIIEVDPNECPFREFRDNELHTEYWGMGPAATRAAMLMSKVAAKTTSEALWLDDQTQPLPRSVRQYLHGWIRAEDLAKDRWEAEVVIFEDQTNFGKMSLTEIQLSHAQVLLRSSFCRRVMSACFILERVEAFTVEHQWENFIFGIQPEGWRARYHIYSPGMKPGGGNQHRPGLSKTGCYLVRLFYLGAWRCVWVSDQIPVDATDSPLLPFSPLISYTPGQKLPSKPALNTVTAAYVHLWPLLLCKALLKLAAPDMNSDEGTDCIEDELMSEFSIMHALTGSLHMTYWGLDGEQMWNLLITEVPVFAWDDDDDTQASTVKSKSVKKPVNKDSPVIKRGSMTTILLEDTKYFPPYHLPGITPAHEMDMLAMMCRDLPLKKPLPEPEVEPWKEHRWVDWARRHGLYEDYDCPRTRFLKVNGLLKLSHAPHLLDVTSTESITVGFRQREQNEKENKTDQMKKQKDVVSKSIIGQMPISMQMKEELREWMPYEPLQGLVKSVGILFYPSMYQYTSAASNAPVRVTKTAPNRAVDMQAPKWQPLYLQIDGPEADKLRMSLNVIHPRIFLNCGVPIVDYIEPAYMVLEKFEWFKDCELPKAKGFIQTRGYDSVEIEFQPGRHFCRIWVHSRTNWHIMLVSESTLVMGPRDLIQCATVRECPWASIFLGNLSTAFITWVRSNRSTTTANAVQGDRGFYQSYQPDLPWDPEVVGYPKHMLHWMFRQALQSHLAKKLQPPEYQMACGALRRVFYDPDFGFPPKPKPSKSLRDIANLDPCDCVEPEVEETEQLEEMEEQQEEVHSLVDAETMAKLLLEPEPPVMSQICEIATEELPCSVLKEEREKVIKKHEAATLLQANWRGTWARLCLKSSPLMSPDVMKIILENAFGNMEALSALMNEFFLMYPGAKYAYSVASALSGVYSLNQHHGTTHVTPKCKWIPYFQGTFYCHAPVKVHFDIDCTLQQATVDVYDNDSGKQLPQVYNSHITFDVEPNIFGYSVLGHTSLLQPYGHSADVSWQLTVLCSTYDAFHVCDNDPETCREIPLQHATKLHIDEIFIPNRRNILGGVQISVLKHETISFRAAASSPELELEAVLRTTTAGEVEELDRCYGKGELYWPYIQLMSSQPPLSPTIKKGSFSQSQLPSTDRQSQSMSARSMKSVKEKRPKLASGAKNRSINKFKTAPEPKVYTIEVIAPTGWPLTLEQWKRVDEARNTIEKVEVTPKKAAKEKASSAKDKSQPAPPIYQPLPDDAFTELECTYSAALGAQCKRDDERDLLFSLTVKGWDVKEPGRNLRGANIRKEFRTEFLESLSVPPPAESTHSMMEDALGEFFGEEAKQEQPEVQQGPTPVTESGLIEMSMETEEEARYLTLPDQLRDKFIPLYFLPLCTKEKSEDETVVLSSDMAEAAKQDRHARIEVALNRMKELQIYNELHVLRRQRERAQLLETLFVDSHWNPELMQVMLDRDDAVALETLNRTLSATKKKEAGKVKK